MERMNVESVGSIGVTHAVLPEKEDGQFISVCPELDVMSCGDSIEEAFANLEEAIDVYLSALGEVGERMRVLQERGIDVSVQPTDEEDGYRIQRPARHAVPT